MIRDIEFPSDFDSIDQDPLVSVTDKLAIIQASPVYVHSTRIGDRIYDDEFKVSLPFVYGGEFCAGVPSEPEVLLIEHITIGDAQLYKNGIGSRLLKAAIRRAVELNPDTTELYAVWARMGLVNAVVSVLGEENVGVMKGGKRYGWQGQESLDAMLDDFPYKEGERYQVHELFAHVDPNQAMTWTPPDLK